MLKLELELSLSACLRTDLKEKQTYFHCLLGGSCPPCSPGSYKAGQRKEKMDKTELVDVMNWVTLEYIANVRHKYMPNNCL